VVSLLVNHEVVLTAQPSASGRTSLLECAIHNLLIALCKIQMLRVLVT
jgi:hypothetical protein